MCTVTYLPYKSGYILTSNRDEMVNRPSANGPAISVRNGQSLLYPEDALHKGTWIACSDSKRTLCLLNGGLKKHTPEPPYRKSRGLVVLEAFEYADAQDFLFRYNLEGIEPFTLVFKEEDKLSEIRWDGIRTYIKSLKPDQAYIWSSVTLYPEDVIEKRNVWFRGWLNTHAGYSIQDIIHFHHFGGEGDPEIDIQMNRNNKLRTVSVTSVVCSKDQFEMVYEDLKTGASSTQKLAIDKGNVINETIKI